MNDILQIGAVITVLAICLIWLIRRIRRRIRGGECDERSDACEGCGLIDHCKKIGRKKE